MKTIVTLCVLLSSLVLPVTSDQSSKAVNVDARALPSVQPTLLQGMADARGGFIMLANGEPAQIVDLVFGLDNDDRLNIAYSHIMMFDGEERIMDRRSSRKKIFSKLSEIRGFLTTMAGTDVWVEDIAFGLNSQGFLVTASLAGFQLNGERLLVNREQDGSVVEDPIEACSCIWLLGCNPNTCVEGPCEPGSCACDDENSSCESYTQCRCPAAGYCAPPKACSSGTVGTCKCK